MVLNAPKYGLGVIMITILIFEFGFVNIEHLSCAFLRDIIIIYYPVMCVLHTFIMNQVVILVRL